MASRKLEIGTLVLALAALLSLPAIRGIAWAATDVTSCGQVVEGQGLLTVDLDCSTTAGAAITLAAKATRDLGGHTIVGSPTSPGIFCSGRCRITNGAIIGAQYGVLGGRAVMEVTDLQVSGSALGGIWTPLGKLVASNITVANGDMGIRAKVARISGAQITGTSTVGILADRKLILEDATISSNNGGGVESVRATIRRSQVTANLYGVNVRKGSAFDTTIASNDQFGVEWKSWKLIGSTVTGNPSNPSAPDCTLLNWDCADVVAHRARLRNSTCETSIALSKDGHPEGTLGICTLD